MCIRDSSITVLANATDTAETIFTESKNMVSRPPTLEMTAFELRIHRKHLNVTRLEIFSLFQNEQSVMGCCCASVRLRSVLLAELSLAIGKRLILGSSLQTYVSSKNIPGSDASKKTKGKDEQSQVRNFMVS